MTRYVAREALQPEAHIIDTVHILRFENQVSVDEISGIALRLPKRSPGSATSQCHFEVSAIRLRCTDSVSACVDQPHLSGWCSSYKRMNQEPAFYFAPQIFAPVAPNGQNSVSAPLRCTDPGSSHALSHAKMPVVSLQAFVSSGVAAKISSPTAQEGTD